MPELNLSEIIGKPIGRTNVSFTRELSADEESSRVVESVSLTSETPIYHWFGYIILDHKPESIRLERFNSNNMPVLWAHERTNQLGAWSNPRVEKGKLRADAKFSQVGLGAEKFTDVKDGICTSISAGFYMWDLEPELDKKGNQVTIQETLVFRCKDWEPFEASLEPTPADISVGVGRTGEQGAEAREQAIQLAAELLKRATERNSTNEENKNMPDPIIPAPAAPATEAAPAVETRTADQIFADNRLAAARTLSGWAEVQPANAALIRTYLDNVPTTEIPTETAMREYLKANQTPNADIPVGDPAEIAARNGGGNPNAIQFARTIPRGGAVTAFDRGSKDANAEAAYRLGAWALATVFRGLAPDGGKFEKAERFALENGLITRGMAEGVNAKGGYLVPEEFGNDLIDLVLSYGVFRRNANVVQMTSDTRSDPRFVDGPIVYFVNESQTIPESSLTMDRINLVAKKLGVLVPYSSELNEDAIVDIGNMIADKTARAFAKREDECGFFGDGTSYYGGMFGVIPSLLALNGTIANIAGIKVGSGNLYSELVIQDFADSLALMPDYEGASDDRMKWYMNKGFYYNVAMKLMLAAPGNVGSYYQDRAEARLLGYPVEFVNVFPKTEANSQVVALFGDLAATATMGVRREFTFVESTEYRFAQDDIVAKATERFGINVHSVGNASATAADRLAGPMVALITAAS